MGIFNRILPRWRLPLGPNWEFSIWHVGVLPKRLLKKGLEVGENFRPFPSHFHIGVSKNRGTPKSSILGYPYFWKHPYAARSRLIIKNQSVSSPWFFLRHSWPAVFFFGSRSRVPGSEVCSLWLDWKRSQARDITGHYINHGNLRATPPRNCLALVRQILGGVAFGGTLKFPW